MNKIFEEAIKEKDKLISEMRTIILSTNSKNGNSNASYAPSIIDANGHYYIFISELSQHTKNIIENSNLSIMIIEDESKANNIFARKRLTMVCDSQIIKRDSKNWSQIINKMEKKFGDTIIFLREMTDFHLFKLVPKNGLLVYGFGKAFKLLRSDLGKIDHINDKGHVKK